MRAFKENIEITYPVQRKSFTSVTSGFGMRDDPLNPGTQKMHRGIDLPATSSDKIVAAMSGTVLYVGYEQNGAGNYVVYGSFNAMTGEFTVSDQFGSVVGGTTNNDALFFVANGTDTYATTTGYTILTDLAAILNTGDLI